MCLVCNVLMKWSVFHPASPRPPSTPTSKTSRWVSRRRFLCSLAAMAAKAPPGIVCVQHDSLPLQWIKIANVCVFVCVGAAQVCVDVRSVWSQVGRLLWFHFYFNCDKNRSDIFTCCSIYPTQTKAFPLVFSKRLPLISKSTKQVEFTQRFTTRNKYRDKKKPRPPPAFTACPSIKPVRYRT